MKRYGGTYLLSGSASTPVLSPCALPCSRVFDSLFRTQLRPTFSLSHLSSPCTCRWPPTRRSRALLFWLYPDPRVSVVCASFYVRLPHLSAHVFAGTRTAARPPSPTSRPASMASPRAPSAAAASQLRTRSRSRTVSPRSWV